MAEELVAVLDDLVGPTDEFKTVTIEELPNDVRTEGETNSTVVLRPTLDLVGICPENVAEET